MKYLLTSLLVFGFLFTPSAFSSHLLGTELTYTCNGNDSYTFKLTIYRDCAAITTGIPPSFDNVSYFTIFTGDGNVYENKPTQSYYQANYNPLNNTLVNIQIADSCIIPPNYTCIEATYYEFTVNLPFDSLGYHIVYERCCKNNNLVNLLNSGTTGITTSLFLSKEAQQFCNNSPTFKAYSNYLFCVNQTTEIDFSAIDNDSDSLVYSLCASNSGGSPTNPQPQNVSNPPPYPTATYANGFSPTQPISGSLIINPNTGIVTASPTASGLYSIAVCVDEYRNGVWLSSIKRDIQVMVVHCEIAIFASVASDSIDPLGNFHISICQSEHEFINLSGQMQFIDKITWEFNINNNILTSYLYNPTVIFPDTIGIYTSQLTISGDIGCFDTANIIVHVEPNHDFNIDFSYNYDSTIFDPITFQSLANNPNVSIINWFWQFGDNYSSQLQNPVHYYPDSGIYTVKHIAIDSVGCLKSFTKEVDWYPLPILLNNEKINSNTDVQLYPNPAKDILNIKIEEKIFEENVSLIIYNSIGEKVFEKNAINKKLIQIPIRHLTNGQYFLIIKNENDTYFSKFIVQK